MALKQNEKMLVGLMMIVGGLALVIGVGLPQWDAFSTTNSQISTLNDEIKALDAQKTNLNSQIALLERNSNLAKDILIRKYTADNKDEVIKAMLDEIVNMATGSGNKFISLVPGAAAPIVSTENTNGKPDATDKTKPAADNNKAADPNAPAEVPSPILSTFGYDLTIRGTYGTLQSFLRSLDSQKEMLEVTGVTIENEAGAERDEAPGPDKVIDPSYPLRLTANLKLVLQPQ